MFNSLSKKPESIEQWFSKNLVSLEACGGSKAKMELHRDKHGRIIIEVKPERSIIRWLKNTLSRDSRDMLRTLHNQALTYAVQPTPIALRIARNITAGIIPRVNAQERQQYSAENVSRASQASALTHAKEVLNTQIIEFQENWGCLEIEDIQHYQQNYLLVSLLDPEQISTDASRLHSRLAQHPVFGGQPQAYIACHNQALENALNYFSALLTPKDAQALVAAALKSKTSPAKLLIENYFSHVVTSFPVQHSEMVARKELCQKLMPTQDPGVLETLRKEVINAIKNLKLQNNAEILLRFDINSYENYLARKAELLTRIKDNNQSHNRESYQRELKELVEPPLQKMKNVVKLAMTQWDYLNEHLRPRWQNETLHDKSLTPRGFPAYITKLEAINTVTQKYST